MLLLSADYTNAIKGPDGALSKKRLSIQGAGHAIHPYLLKGLPIERISQVWQIDISYIPMKKGFMYMMATIDVNSRYIVNWGLSNTMYATWCTQVYKEAISLHGALRSPIPTKGASSPVMSS